MSKRSTCVSTGSLSLLICCKSCVLDCSNCSETDLLSFNKERQYLTCPYLLLGKVGDSYEALVKSMKNKAISTAYQKELEEGAKLYNEEIAKQLRYQKEINKLLALMPKENTSEFTKYLEDPNNKYGQVKYWRSLLKESKSVSEQLEQSNTQLLQQISKLNEPVETHVDLLLTDIQAYQDFIKEQDELNKKLSLSAITQDEYNRRLNEAKGQLIDAADAANIGGSALEKLRDEYIAFNKASINKEQVEKQKKEAEKQKEIQERVNQQLLDLQNKNQQSRINLMEEGSDKRIAQIEYDYDREIEAIRKREKEWREAQGGKLTQEQTVEIKTAITQAQATRMRSTQEVENEQIEAQRKAMNDYLKEYGTHQDKKIGTRRRVRAKK